MNNAEIIFDLDLRIKRLIELSRPQYIIGDMKYNFDQVDKILENLDLINSLFNKMCEIAGLHSVNEEANKKVAVCKEKILNCNYDYNKLMDVYENHFLKMSPNLEEALGKNLFGYSAFRNTFEALDECNTLNDLLHMAHFCVVNNEKFYKQMPIIEKKENKNNQNIILCGTENEISRKLYDAFPYELDCDEVNILSFKDKNIIMVRGKGHALSIETHIEGDNIRINYFIPKACNIEMVNKLKGVKKLDPNNSSIDDMTNGEFVIKKEEFANEVISFISQVPTDYDSPSQNIRM